MLTTRKSTRRWGTTALWAAVFLAGCTPPGPRALLDGERLLQAGRPEEAVRRLRTAVEFLPSNAQAWNHLGLALHAAHQPAEAAEAYQQALRHDRNLAVAHYNLGCLWFDQGDAGKAADAFRTHVGLLPRSGEGWLKLGQAQLRLRQWDQADRSFTTALRLGPPEPEALNGLGVAHQQRRRNREAWQCFTNAIGVNPRFAPAWLNLAVVAHQAGARPQAIQAYRQFASLRPDRAHELGLEAVIRQLETNAGPTFQLPPAPGSAPAVAPPTNRPPAAVAPTRSATAPTNAAPPAAGASNAPAQPRPPPRHAELERPVPTDASAAGPITAAPPVSRPASSRPTNAVSTASTPPPPSPIPAAPVPAPTNEPVAVSVSIPVSVRPPASEASRTTAPVTVARATGTVPPSAESTPTNAAPIEVVEVPAPPTLSTNVRDEPWNAPLPATSAPPASAAESRPIVRPVGAQRDPDASGRSGFWSRANPSKWFGSAKEEAPPKRAEDSPASAASTEEERSRWQWANPASWFRSGKADSAEPTPAESRRPVVPVVASSRPEPAVTPNPVAAAPERSSAPTNAVLLVADAKPPRPPAAPSAPRRYLYLNPPAPMVGDGAAARPVLAEAIQEHQRGRLDTAVKKYEDALKLDPGSFEGQHNLAIAELQAGEAPKALAAAETALALQPASVPARFHFALALDAAGFPADAAIEAEKVVAAKADHAEAHLLLGNLYAQKLGKPQRAREHYLVVIDLQPDHPQNAAIRRWLSARR